MPGAALGADAARLEPATPTGGWSLPVFRVRFVSNALSSFNLGTVLLAGSGLFCLATLYFGTRGGYYDSDDYDGNGTAH